MTASTRNMSTSDPKSTKKKTILRVKRRFSDIQAVDTIVLSQPLPKRQRTIPLNELTQSFDKNLKIVDNDNNETKTDRNKTAKFDFNFNFNDKTEHKRQVFRLICSDSVSRSFQQSNFNEKYSKNRKSKILQQRRSHRQNYFDKIEKKIKEKTNTNANTNTNILQHEDFYSANDSNARATNKKTKNNNENIKMIQKKLLKKHKVCRSTKIVSKKEIKQHQNKLKLRNNKSANINSNFSDDWNNNNLITLHHNGETINMKNFINKYDCFNGYSPKKSLHNNKGINIINITNSNDDHDEYDYYELDEEADADQVLAAIQMRKKEKEKEKAIKQKEEIKQNENETENDKLDLEWKLEKIKNKYLERKHFDRNYEGPSFGFKHSSKESEQARHIEIETNDLIQNYHENLINDPHEYEYEELEKDDEGYIDNQYPDEHQFSDEDDHGDHLYDIEDDYYPRYNDRYHTTDQTNNYDQNALGLDFFASI